MARAPSPQVRFQGVASAVPAFRDGEMAPMPSRSSSPFLMYAPMARPMVSDHHRRARSPGFGLSAHQPRPSFSKAIPVQTMDDEANARAQNYDTDVHVESATGLLPLPPPPPLPTFRSKFEISMPARSSSPEFRLSGIDKRTGVKQRDGQEHAPKNLRDQAQAIAPIEIPLPARSSSPHFSMNSAVHNSTVDTHERIRKMTSLTRTDSTVQACCHEADVVDVSSHVSTMRTVSTQCMLESKDEQEAAPLPISRFEIFRLQLRKALMSKPFDACIILLILANTVTLALDSPSSSEELKDVLEIFELVFLILFTVEMLLKMLAFGFVGKDPKGYFRSGWNWLDFVIVVLGWVTEFASSSSGLSALRAMRVFRLLKGVGRVGGMKILVESFGKALPALCDVFALLAFFLALFTIVGVQLFAGVLNRRCYIPIESGNFTYYELDAEQEGRCTTTGSASIFTGWPCNNGTTCLEPSTFPTNSCAVNQTDCPFAEPVLSWDNSLKGMLISIKIFSLDDWPTDQEGVQDGLLHLTWIFFWILIILGSLFAINLVLGVQSSEFTKSANEEREARLHAPAKVRRTDKPWHRLRNRIEDWWAQSSERGPKRQKVWEIVTSRWFGWLMIGVTVLNVLFLAVDYYKAPQALKDAIHWINFTCTFLFVIEAGLKLFGLGLRDYFRERANVADFVLVILSLVELGLSGSSAISSFRAFRLARLVTVLRGAKRVQRVLHALAASVVEAVSMFLLLLVFLVIFSILGMQLYGTEGVSFDDPRFSFVTLWESFYTVFIVVTGETWVTMMSLTMQDTNWSAALYFLAVFLIGNYLVVNLFICILIDAMGHHYETQEKEKEKAKKEKPPGWRVMKLFPRRARRKSGVPPVEEGDEPDGGNGNGGGDGHNGDNGNGGGNGHSPRDSTEVDIETLSDPESASSAGTKELYFLEARETAKPRKSQPAIPADAGVRSFMKAVVEHRFFQWFILSLIILNAGFLCFETPWTTDNCIADPCDAWSLTLYIANIVFVVLFTIELIMNLMAFGFHGYVGYWAEGRWHAQWGNYIDIFVVFAALVGLFVPQMKIFRSLRTLRIVSRVERIRVVVGALVGSIPVLSSVVIVLAFIWFLFAILGVQLMMGRYGACVDADTGDTTEFNEVDCVGGTLSWESPRWDFDNILVAFVTLTILALGEGWAAIMWQAIDSTGQGTAPEKNASPWFGIFFLAFMVCGSFLALNLFVATLLDAFLRNSNSVAVLTDEERAFVRAMRVLLKSMLPPAAKAPNSRYLKFIYTIVRSFAFEVAINVLIVVNIIFMALEYYNQPEGWETVLDTANYVFVALFTLEALLKILALNPKQYFADKWNRFDLFVVVISLIGLAIDGPSTSVFRMLRILRLFRLVRFCKGLQNCFTTLILALAPLGNIIVVQLLIMFIFGVMGVELFGRIPVDTGGGLTHNLNFSNIYYALVLLFTISTTETWPDVMDNCATGLNGSWVAVPFFVLYMVCNEILFLSSKSNSSIAF